MSLVISATNTEFAVSSGGNLNPAPGVSIFNGAPSGTTNLTISSLDGDGSPYRFDVGDHYNLTFDGPGGTVTLAGATVIRSDNDLATNTAVVFEGHDQNNALVRVVWSPDFNLEQWYWDAVLSGATPEFYTTDQHLSTYAYPCFGAGTLIDTPGGPVPVERLRPGDPVLTVDHGPRPVLGVFHGLAPGRGARAPVELAPGALGNRRPFLLSPQHRVLLAGPELELLFGESEALAPVAALAGGRGIRRVPRDRVALVHLVFDRHELVWAEGAVVESLLLGPRSRADLADALGLIGPGEHARLAARIGPMEPARPLLRAWEARLLRARPPGARRGAVESARAAPGG